MPNVRQIEVVERESVDDGVRLTNRWHAASTEIRHLPDRSLTRIRYFGSIMPIGVKTVINAHGGLSWLSNRPGEM